MSLFHLPPEHMLCRIPYTECHASHNGVPYVFDAKLVAAIDDQFIYMRPDHRYVIVDIKAGTLRQHGDAGELIDDYGDSEPARAVAQWAGVPIPLP